LQRRCDLACSLRRCQNRLAGRTCLLSSRWGLARSVAGVLLLLKPLLSQLGLLRLGRLDRLLWLRLQGFLLARCTRRHVRRLLLLPSGSCLSGLRRLIWLLPLQAAGRCRYRLWCAWSSVFDSLRRVWTRRNGLLAGLRWGLQDSRASLWHAGRRL